MTDYVIEPDATGLLGTVLVDGVINSIRAPGPGPEPEPQPDAELIEHMIIDQARVLLFKTFHQSSRYERFQRLVVLETSPATIQFHSFNFPSGGTVNALQGTIYGLIMDGEEVATATVAPGATTGTFTLPLGDISEGWHIFKISGEEPTCAAWPMYVHHEGGTVDDSVMYVCTGSWELH